MEDKIRIVFRRGSILQKITVTAAVTLSMVTLLTVWAFKQKEVRQYEVLRQKAIALEQDNSRLQQTIDRLGTVEGIAQVAREKLGLVDPGTIIIEPEK